MTNAVVALVARLPAALLKHRLGRDGLSPHGALARLTRRLAARWELDLIGFLNGSDGKELAALATAVLGDDAKARAAGTTRLRLWAWGAALERRALGGDVDASVQPAPVLHKGGKLRLARRRREQGRGVLPTARAARFPDGDVWPRPVPPARRPPAAPAGEPDTLDELLARAHALVGVPLGSRGRDKGWYGQRVADLLGLPRSSAPSPDWRGEVEVKTLAVVRAAGRRWRLKDGPAISMRGVDARGKMRRVLWVVRVDETEEATVPILTWFYQELDRELTTALERARHLRPKGGAGTTARGWYLRRDFFEACGLMRSLNGDG